MKAQTKSPPLVSLDLPAKRDRSRTRWKRIRKNWDLYACLSPGLIYFFIFSYIPMFGLLIAFKDYNIFRGVFDSPWNNFAYFKEMVQLPDFYKIVRNTLMLNVLGLVIGFPAPIILAIMLNEVGSKYFKRISQSLLYLPHFMSWVLMGGMIYALLSPKFGIVNLVLQWIGLEPIYFMASNSWWVSVFIGSGIWAGVGWGTIIYLAAMTTLDPHLYEAASIDGAGRWKKIVNITIPGIMPTIVILLILNIGHMVSIGFEQPYALMNPLVMDVADVLSTYIYELGIRQGGFGLTTAIGMVQSIVNLMLIIGANYAANKMGREGIW
ncbi:ABC transporter permease [Paenibacillus spongiae]|uniref:ABC transporter permease subunit n=1 Tax=Paenibacillus spongiae TaxID=2909671 RepID=A0ABY5SFQ5_9BACL|nr:ABC transporter permease subunit [Paenibacillus spongiae]UVI32807.1 ABC transporter permease subunit [Paenibacillus spongiae]